MNECEPEADIKTDTGSHPKRTQARRFICMDAEKQRKTALV